MQICKAYLEGGCNSAAVCAGGAMKAARGFLFYGAVVEQKKQRREEEKAGELNATWDTERIVHLPAGERERERM